MTNSRVLFIVCLSALLTASLVAQIVQNLSAMQETRVQSLGLEDPLEKEMATHSSIIAWRIPWIEEPGRPSPWGPQGVGDHWVTNTFTFSALPYQLLESRGFTCFAQHCIHSDYNRTGTRKELRERADWLNKRVN